MAVIWLGQQMGYLMGNMFNIQYPPRFYTGLDGGKNNRVAKQWLLDNESPDCQNVVFGFGSVETRQGTNKLNTTTVGTFACDGLYTRHDNNGAETMCAWYGGSMYALTGTSTFTAVASATSAFTAGTRIFATEYENNIFFGNGAGIPYRYNGADFVRHGIYAPTSASIAGSNASGICLPTATYQYVVTYVNSGLVESDISPATTFAVSGGTGAGLTSLPVAPQSFGVSYRYIYRSEDSGVNYFRVGTISNNTATTFADTTTSAAVGAAAPDDQGVPVNYSAILTHQSRLFMIDPVTNWIWYTEIDNPYVVKATNFRRIGDKTQEIPQALGLWDNFLVVFCKTTTWLVHMPTADDADWVDFKIRSPYGSKSPFCVFSAENKLYFAAMQNGKFVGFAGLTASGVDPDAAATEIGAIGSDLITERIKDDIDDYSSAYLQNMTAFVHDKKVYVSYTYTKLTTNTKILVIDYSDENLNKKQKITFAPWTGLQATQFCLYNNSLYFGSANAVGFVYKMNNGLYTDDGALIDSYTWSKEFAGAPGHEAWHKDWRFSNILYELSGDWNMGISTRVDSDSSMGVIEQVDLNPWTSLWGSLIWGNGNWEAGRTERDYKKTLGQFRGKRIQFRFSNTTAGSKFRVVGLSLTYNLKGRR